MEIGDIIKNIMRSKRVSQKALGQYIGKLQTGIASDLGRSPKAIKDRLRMLDYLGYEVIVREKRPGRRAEGEYVVSAGKEKSAEIGAGNDIEEKPIEVKKGEAIVKGMPEATLEEGIRLLREQIAQASGGNEE